MPLFRKTDRRQVLDIPVREIRPNPGQPRRDFDRQGLEELSRSIASVGILQPQLAGLATVPCLPVEADEQTSSLLALIENLQRRDLDVWEEAEALRKLIEQFHLSQEEAARRVGKSQSAVANKLRLLKLPPDVIAELRANRLTERHARALLRLEDPERQRAALAHILKARLNVAKTEEYIDRLCKQAEKPRTASPIYRIKDVRLFLNTIKRGLAVMQSAGVAARCGREETDSEITLTIHIPK